MIGSKEFPRLFLESQKANNPISFPWFIVTQCCPLRGAVTRTSDAQFLAASSCFPRCPRAVWLRGWLLARQFLGFGHLPSVLSLHGSHTFHNHQSHRTRPGNKEDRVRWADTAKSAPSPPGPSRPCCPSPDPAVWVWGCTAEQIKPSSVGTMKAVASAHGPC